ncbi:hypothetical protein ACFSE1_10675 [Rhizobium helianthi]|uniref:Uncharacterized protein n=1 Tax=Rhizobium helianthi TaxID=1132695 RepID=A0ABW4M3W7_9HYPH
MSPLLFDCGRNFADFIETYEYAQTMPWLADVARLERAWLDAYHAADANHLDPGALAAIAPEQTGDIFIPSLQSEPFRTTSPSRTAQELHLSDGATQETPLEDRILVLCIVIGLSWRDFCAMWHPAKAVLPWAAIRMTAASALFLAAVGLAFSVTDLRMGLATTGLGAVIALLAGERVGSDTALITATLGFAVYIAGMAS